MADTIELGGRQFKVVNFARRTVLQDHYLQRNLRLIGADQVMPMDGEDNAAYLVRLHARIIDSGRAHELIAGYLLPVEKTERDFTPDMAKEIAAHIALCDTPEDRETITGLATEVAFGFFKQGLEQWQRSLAYSAQASTAQTENPGHPETVHSILASGRT